jgi:putative hydrolase of the HAD superfamily
VGISKPARRIFEAALDAAGAEPIEAVMFGDGWHNDIVGARDAGIAAVWFNPLAAESLDRTVPELQSLEPTSAALERLLYGAELKFRAT